jgi:hypothetical protein
MALGISNQNPNPVADNTPASSSTLQQNGKADGGKESTNGSGQRPPASTTSLSPTGNNSANTNATSGTASILNEFGLPLYPGLKAVALSPAFLGQIAKKKESATLPLTIAKGEQYSTTADLAKVKTYYQTEFEKSGSQWKNLSAILPGIVGMDEITSQLEGAGGFVLFYHRDNYYLEIGGIPYAIYKLSADSGVGSGENVIFFGYLVEKN